MTKGKVNDLFNVTPGESFTSKVCHCRKNSNALNSDAKSSGNSTHRRQTLTLSGKMCTPFALNSFKIRVWQICSSRIIANIVSKYSNQQIKLSQN